MKSLDRRLSALEQRDGSDVLQVGVIIRSIVRPGANGPEETGEEYASILIGPSNGIELTRYPNESSAAFRTRIHDLTGSV